MESGDVQHAADWTTLIAGGGGSVLLTLLLVWSRSVVRFTLTTGRDQQEQISKLEKQLVDLRAELATAQECLKCAEERADQYQERYISHVEGSHGPAPASTDSPCVD